MSHLQWSTKPPFHRPSFFRWLACSLFCFLCPGLISDLQAQDKSILINGIGAGIYYRPYDFTIESNGQSVRWQSFTLGAAVVVNKRWNLKEPQPERSLCLSMYPGFMIYGSQPFVTLSLPLLVEGNLGAGATEDSEFPLGLFGGVGAQALFITEYEAPVASKWSFGPVASAGIRLRILGIVLGFRVAYQRALASRYRDTITGMFLIEN